MLKRSLLLIFLLGLTSLSATAQSNSSLYTSLGEKQCKTIESSSDEGGSYVGMCPGVSGYKLKVHEYDLRQGITVIAPGGQEHPLDLSRVVGFHFSSLGEKAEWRVKNQNGKVVPVALIVRYNLAETDNSTKETSYLVVAKITPAKICVTDKIAPGANANVAARAAADNAATKPCLKIEE